MNILFFLLPSWLTFRGSLLADRYAGELEYVSSEKHLSFSPRDGKYLATGHSTGRTMVVKLFSVSGIFPLLTLVCLLQIWQVGKNRVRNAFGTRPVGFNNCVDFSPDGRFVVSSSYSDGVHIWSMRDGSSNLLQDPDVRSFGTIAVKFSPDGKHVVASDLHGMVRL
jgi:WD40 repeat protein